MSHQRRNMESKIDVQVMHRFTRKTQIRLPWKFTGTANFICLSDRIKNCQWYQDLP